MTVQAVSGRKLLAVLAGLVLTLGLIGAVGAQEPIEIDPVETPGSGAGSWDAGVFVQRVNVAGEVRGEWNIVSCRVHVQTTPDGVGEVMTAMTRAGEITAEVKPQSINREVIGGRAIFQLDPGTALLTTNTNPAVTAACPSN